MTIDIATGLDKLRIDAWRVHEAVRLSLTDADRLFRYRGPSSLPVAGHCYVASEAAYHLLGGKDAGWTPMQIQHGGGSHWYLRHESGLILDITSEQFFKPVPYANGRGRGFLTRQPSKRAARVIDRATEKLLYGL
jgi:hypothetical protein